MGSLKITSALKEIEKVLKKHDLVGYVHVSDGPQTEFHHFLHTSSGWFPMKIASDKGGSKTSLVVAGNMRERFDRDRVFTASDILAMFAQYHQQAHNFNTGIIQYMAKTIGEPVIGDPNYEHMKKVWDDHIARQIAHNAVTNQKPTGKPLIVAPDSP